MNDSYQVISDFLFFEGAGGRIYADKCEIYKDFGILLYKENAVIASIKNPIAEVKHVKVSDIKEHYYIKAADSLACYYLVTKKTEEDRVISPNTLVLLKGSITAGLSHAIAKDPNFFPQYEEQIKKDCCWSVRETKEDIILILEREDEIKVASYDDVLTITELLEMTEQHKEILNRT